MRVTVTRILFCFSRYTSLGTGCFCFVLSESFPEYVWKMQIKFFFFWRTDTSLFCSATVIHFTFPKVGFGKREREKTICCHFANWWRSFWHPLPVDRVATARHKNRLHFARYFLETRCVWFKHHSELWYRSVCSLCRCSYTLSTATAVTAVVWFPWWLIY